MNQLLSVTKKELKAYFGSPMAALFIGAFLLAALFSFFWVETFFARNIADIRPLFRWMPLLMIFLVAALTMRQWSEEQRMGTMEILMTLPVRLRQLVFGKFLAVLILVATACALTLGLPITVSLLGNLDWGPVIGGYVGALLMASAYIAIGLFISSRTDNQIVALIMTVLVAGFFYMLGSADITNFMGNTAGNFLRSLGTGSRFASIERGVIDLRDVLYYATLAGVFLTLNILSLDRKRWSFSPNTGPYRRRATLIALLVCANLIAVNLWMAKVNILRLDLTENKEYSLSATSRDLIAGLTEPLLMRGYFSEKTHPLLSPLVPQIKDLMQEYAIASGGKIKVEFVDPKYHPEMEAEANQLYGIKPVPFQVAGRYEASVVNSYFHILIKYGDQHVTLSFNDIIEVEQRPDGRLDVRLRNLEYDLTKSIKKVVYGFQSLATVFEKIESPITLTAVVSRPLPKPLATLPDSINKVARQLVKESMGKLHYETIDPGHDPAKQADVKKRFGAQAVPVSLFSNETFYLGLYLTVGDKSEQIYLKGDMGEAEIRKEVEAVLKRSSSGFLKTIGLWTPPSDVPPQMAMMGRRPTDHYRAIKQVLPEDYNLEEVDLKDGRVPGNIDVLLVVAPQNLSEMQLFAIDQYLMRGGAVAILTGSYQLDLNPYARTLNVKKIEGGVKPLLAHYGLTLGDAMVMDMRNEPFPIPVTRNLGGLVVQEIKQINYPFFVDVRKDAMATGNPVTSNLPAVTLNWVSPITIDKEKNKDRSVVELLHSSPQSWLYTGSDIQPDFKRYPESGFAPGKDMKAEVLAVAAKGSFTSYYADHPDPRDKARAEKEKKAREEAQKKDKKTASDTGKDEAPELPPAPLIKKSPESSRLVVVGSSEFINDTVISISQSSNQDRYLNSLGLVQNIVDWSVEDEDLLVIRSRGTHARLLRPMTREQQRFWEWLNYGIAIFALIAVSLYGGMRRRKEQPLF